MSGYVERALSPSILGFPVIFFFFFVTNSHFMLFSNREVIKKMSIIKIIKSLVDNALEPQIR